MTNQQKPPTKTIELRISVPAWRLPPRVVSWLARFNTLNRRQKACVVAILVAILGSGVYFLTHQVGVDTKSAQAETDTTDGRRFPSDVARTPDYPTLLPQNKTIQTLGGWTRVSPPKSNPVFAYTDTLAGDPINVSQQPLPDEFKEDTDAQIEQLATGYGALEHVKAADITLFIGTSAKGPQSVIFRKNNNLFLIKSTTPHSQDEWTGYVNSLR